MKSETAAIQPRSRRRTAHRLGGVVAAPVSDPRTRVLIRVPWIKSGPESKPKIATPSVAEPAASAATDAAASSSENVPSLPPKLPATAERLPYLRIDAAHAAVPAPHSASPAWSQPSQGRLAKLSGQPLIWATAIVSAAVVVVVLFRNGESNSAKPHKAPAATAAQREAKTQPDQVQTDSAASNERIRDPRLASRDPATKATKSKWRTTEQGSSTNAASASTAQQPGLQRKAGANIPAALSRSEARTTESSTIDQPAGMPRNVESGNSFSPEQFRVIDGGPILPEQTAPSSEQATGSENHSARFDGNVQTLVR